MAIPMFFPGEGGGGDGKSNGPMPPDTE